MALGEMTSEMELELIKPEYKVELFGDTDIDPILVLNTHGNWEIAGAFIVVWDEADVKHAYYIPDDVVHIRTTELPGKHVADEKDTEEDEDEATGYPEGLVAEEEPLEPGGEFGDGMK